MSLDDFCRYTPAEFYSIYKQWEVQHVRQPWERARFMACAMLQPYSKKAMKAADVCRFAWEDAGSERDGAHTESSRERFEEIRRRGGG